MLRSDRRLSDFRLPIASAMPVATFELSAPLPWKGDLRRAVSVGLEPHDDHFRILLKKHVSASAHRNFTVEILQKAGRNPVPIPRVTIPLDCHTLL